jgi:hypothetical protein
MVRIYTLKVLLFFIAICTGQLSMAQENKGKVWVTVDDLSILPKLNTKGEFVSSSAALQKVVSEQKINNVSLAFPASRTEKLKKVYEIQCDCNQAVLAEALQGIKGMTRPTEAPIYDLMYEPNDYSVNMGADWALDLINAKGAWDISKGDTSVVLGIADSNFDTTQLELVGKVNYLMPGISDPNTTHGTKVAIIAGGNTDNGFGKSSIGFNSHLRLYSMGYNQILQASYEGARVINMSWASGCSVNSYCQGVIDEIYENGTILVASAGNGSTCGGPDNFVYPASYNHVISVTSIGADDSHTRMHNGVNYPHQHNASVDLSAPGYNVPITAPGNTFGVFSGTSYASPFVTGTIGLMLDANPCLTFEEVETILKETSTNIDALNPTYLGIIGTGRLNAQAAVAQAAAISKLSFTYSQLNFGCTSQQGTVELTTLGGAEPYTVTWDNGSTGSTSPNLTLGSHAVTIVDADGCKGDTVVVITADMTPVLNFTYIQPLYACELQAGSIVLSSFGGTAPYTVTWSDGSVGNSSPFLPIGTYTVNVVDAEGCAGDTTFEITSLGASSINFDYPSNVSVTSSAFNLSDLNGDGIIKIKGNVTIEEGVDFSIVGKRIEFGYNTDPFAGILIKNNATLSITQNTSLKGLSACKSRWDGIVIADNSVNNGGNYTHSAKAGKLVLDKVNIYNAHCAVKTKVADPLAINSSFKYGTLNISNSVFTSNGIGLDITSTSNAIEKSEVFKTIFLVEDSTLQNTVHINLHNVDNLALLKNRFFGNDLVADEYRGSAIKANNSSLFVAENTSTDLMNISTDGNQFYNLSYGIQSTNTDSIIDNIQITGSYFTKVKEAINIEKYANGMIYSNEIDVPQGNSTAKSFGVQLGKLSSLVVTDNTFTTTNLAPDFVYGVILVDSDTNKMDVYRNSFPGNFTAANLFKGNNLKTFVDCNLYTGTNNDHWVVSGGKLADQTGLDVNGQSLIYKNEFAPCLNGAAQILVEVDASGFVYQSKKIYMPNTASAAVVQAVVVKNGEDNQCRNYFDTSIPMPTVDEVEIGVGANVYPNPTTNNSAVNWNEIDIDHVAVYTIGGEFVQEANVTGIKGTYEINNLSSGVYLVKMSYLSVEIKTEKLVVAR